VKDDENEAAEPETGPETEARPETQFRG
jgi:hypothetical protein